MVKIFTAHRIRGSNWTFEVNSTRQPTEVSWVNNKLNKKRSYSGSVDQVTSKIGELFAQYARDDNYAIKLSIDSDNVMLGAPKSLRPIFPTFTATNNYDVSGSFMSFENADDVQPCVLKIFSKDADYFACLVHWQGKMIGMSLQNWQKIVPLWRENDRDVTALVGLHRDGTMEFVDFIDNGNEDEQLLHNLQACFPAINRHDESQFMFGLNQQKELILYKPYIDIGVIVRRYHNTEKCWELTYAEEIGDDTCVGDEIIKLRTNALDDKRLYSGAIVRIKAIIKNGSITRIVDYTVTPDLEDNEDFTCGQMNAHYLYPHGQFATYEM